MVLMPNRRYSIVMDVMGASRAQKTIYFIVIIVSHACLFGRRITTLAIWVSLRNSNALFASMIDIKQGEWRLPYHVVTACT